MSEIEYLQKHLYREGIVVPVEVIEKWDENERSWAEIYADSLLTLRTYGWASKAKMPACLRPYVDVRHNIEYDGHGLA